MGCSKNLVDSEQLMNMLADCGCTVTHENDNFKGDLLVINTCGFIGDAKEESIEMILNAVQQKKEGNIKRIAVMGCLSQRYAQELRKEIPEVDLWYGKYDWKKLITDINASNPGRRPYGRIITTPRHHAYIKISEGCNRFCSFCAIPLITGRHHSREIEDILNEVKELCAKGVKEFNIIAQDLSSYGRDIYGKSKLAELIDRMADIDGVSWIRLHYAYPADFPLDVLDVMAKRENVCKYLDIALQHISDTVLTNMRRHISSEQTLKLLSEIRKRVPGIHLRTTLMTGFPGEGDKEFSELLDFVNQIKFDRMGAFAYCEEEDTYAAKNFEDSVPADIKQQRLDRLMALQESISEELNAAKVGTEQLVIIDRVDRDYYIGRTQYDSPEVDPEVLIKKDKDISLKIGDMVKVLITDSAPFELYGTLK